MTHVDVERTAADLLAFIVSQALTASSGTEPPRTENDWWRLAEMVIELEGPDVYDQTVADLGFDPLTADAQNGA